MVEEKKYTQSQLDDVRRTASIESENHLLKQILEQKLKIKLTHIFADEDFC